MCLLAKKKEKRNQFFVYNDTIIKIASSTRGCMANGLRNQ